MKLQAALLLLNYMVSYHISIHLTVSLTLPCRNERRSHKQNCRLHPGKEWFPAGCEGKEPNPYALNIGEFLLN